jgi:hypothetical protein
MAAAHQRNERLAQGFHARMATRYALALAQGPSLAELETIARSWVDVAFKIDPRDIRLMQKLAGHQLKRAVADDDNRPETAGGKIYAFAAAS